MTFVRSGWARGVISLVAACGVVALLWWRGPAWSGVASAFAAVQWSWVVAAIGLNLLSVLVRALAWRTVIVQAFEPPYPSYPLVFSAFSVGLFAVAVLGARGDRFAGLDEGLGAVRKVVRLARYGLGVMRRPPAAALALCFQLLGWTCQLFAVYTSMRAFGIHEALPAAGLVLVLMNVATIFPLWPGNVGLVQAAVALPLFTYYGVAKA